MEYRNTADNAIIVVILVLLGIMLGVSVARYQAGREMEQLAREYYTCYDATLTSWRTCLLEYDGDGSDKMPGTWHWYSGN